MKKISFLLLCFPLVALADDKVRVPIQGSKVSVQVPSSSFQDLLDKPLSLKREGADYVGKTHFNAEVVGSEGQVSKGTVRTSFSQRISRKQVLTKVFENAKWGGRIALRGLGWAGLAYGLVDALLVKDGWSYSDTLGNWQKVSDGDKYVLVKTQKYDGWPSISSKPLSKKEFDDLCNRQGGCEVYKTVSRLELDEGKKDLCSTETLQIKGRTESYNTYDVQDRCKFSDRTKSSYDYVSKYFAKAVRVSEMKELSFDDFEGIVGGHADGAPNQYVVAMSKEENPTGATEGLSVDTNPVVEAGTVVQSGMFVSPDGQVKETVWQFGRGANGQTTVSEKTTPRPDKQSMSDELPKSSPGGNVFSPKDDKKESETKGGEKSEGETKPGVESGGDGEEPPKDSKGFLCEAFPNVLGCMDAGNVKEGSFDDIAIPREEVNADYEPWNLFGGNGVCPKDKTVRFAGYDLTLSYLPLCHFLDMVRFAILLGFIVASAFIIFRR